MTINSASPILILRVPPRAMIRQLIIPKRGGRTFYKGSIMKDTKRPFSKPAATADRQYEILKSRGMVFSDNLSDDFIKDYLLFNNYYRLEGYWFEHYEKGSYPDHKFINGTEFNNILKNYAGDTFLRLYTFKFVSLIEIAFRSVFAYTLANNYGPFPYRQEELYCGFDDYIKAINKLQENVRRSKDGFIRSFQERYTDPIPPIWMMVEIMSMG